MASKRRQVSKRRTIQTTAQKQARQKELVYKETVKQVQKTNERLKSLSRHYKKGTWASKKLIDRLDGKQNAYKNGRIRIPKNATTTQLKSIQKATKQFLESKTSTRKGISEVSKSIKEGMKNAFEMEGKDITNSDIEDLYQMMSDDDFTKSDFEDKIGASRMDRYILDAKEKKMNVNNFIDLIEANEFSLDEDLRNKAISLYNKYVK